MRSFKEAVRRATVFCAVLALAACGRSPAPALPTAAAPEPKGEGYLASPTVTAAKIEGDRVVLEGQAEKGAQVRLATPEGQIQSAQADQQGHWRIVAMPADAPRIFGLSMTVDGRQIQAQGYVLLGADGAVTILRGGAGAVQLSVGGRPRITAFDYDRAGGAVVSGVAPAGLALQVRGDGQLLGAGRADPAGRFSIPISQPLAPGAHRLQLLGERVNATAAVEVSPAEPLDATPFRSRQVAGGLRADWMTPGGGVQTTLILN
jgi:hypothetical protein